jgi:hypothetical protein
MDELVVGRRYLIRYRQMDEGPWRNATGLRPFTLVSVGPNRFGNTEFRFRNEINELEFVVVVGAINSNNWKFFNDLPGAAEAIAAAAAAHAMTAEGIAEAAAEAEAEAAALAAYSAYEAAEEDYHFAAPEAAPAAGGLHPLIVNAPNIGELVLPAGINANVINMEPFKNDEAVVILQRPLFGDKHIFRESTISEWFNSNPPPTNPVTRAAITGNGDVVRATIKVPAVGGRRKRHRTFKRMRRSRRSRRSHRSRRRV